ncbi:ArnT family glycosyltransferase [Iningainema tapete]|uniref:Glycosyltransferase family 39 protein n=1 Tax=Iningainema tapete BLCC-T55 TaxID=2748662 RepID=A0A8J6XD57_9CYAN|nr:glycosyltransferase family 39 protein [Iningainema tapete]MBD2772974.1 glycosyltransferase family 39 protein [Iningainema tapete BLCC-T55]
MAHTAKTNLPGGDQPLVKGSLIDPWLVAVLVCFVIFSFATWGKIELPIIDIGREVEISARLLTGQVLYRDIATYYGPLSYYINALALFIFGQRLEVFYAVALFLALVATLLFYRLALRLTNAHWAALSTICMLIYCAIGAGIFYFIVPYSYGTVYATVLCLLAITALDNFTHKGKTIWLIVAAIACGLALLAKQEYGVAALAGVLVGSNLYRPQNLRTRVWRSLIIILITTACVFIPFYLLAQQASWETLRSSLFPVGQISVMNRSNLFQVSPAKTIHIWWDTFKYFFASSLVVLLSLIAAHWLLKPRWIKIPKSLKDLAYVLIAFALTAIIFKSLKTWVFHTETINENYVNVNIFQSLSNLSWCLPVFVAWFAFKRPQLPQYKHAPLLWTLLVFTLLLNARWLFYINFYGLYATTVILLFFTLLYYSTQRLSKLVWNYLLICLLIAGGSHLLGLTKQHYAVNSDYGTFSNRSAALTRAFNQTIQAIKANGATSVLVLPEGNLLNFLTGTHSPSRELTFLPVALPTSADEKEFIQSMQANPPELIVYVDRRFPEWGYKSFAEFNPLVDKWITQQHRLIHTFRKDRGVIRIFANTEKPGFSKKPGF